MSAGKSNKGNLVDCTLDTITESTKNDLEKLPGYWVAKYPEIWQYNLLNPEKLSSFVQKLGLSSFILAQSRIKGLWQLGLLRADLIVSTRKLLRAGLLYVRTMDDGRHIYIDDRPLLRRRKGWGSALGSCKEIPKGLELYFHPFRYYILYCIQRAVDPNINSLQFLLSMERYPHLLETVTGAIKQWSTTEEFASKINECNDVTSLAVATEPWAYQRIYNTVRWQHPNDRKTHEKMVTQHRKNIRPLIRGMGLDRIEEMRRKLCITSEIIDHNKRLHVLLRLMNAESRLKLEGSIGGSMLVLTMAEMLRRIAENEFKKELPEEDEFGFGQWMEGARETLYGTNRVLDAPKTVIKRFLSHQGLDAAPRFRCYVEGGTEYGAIDSVFTPQSGLVLINLSGQFIEGKRKGLSFKESLKSDMHSRILSIVLLDGDRPDNVRVVRKAAERDEMFGLFYILNPDFELANFTVDELGEILWEIASENDVVKSQKAKLIDAIKGYGSGEAVLSAARKAIPELNQVTKGHDWGKRLVSYAFDHPEFDPKGTGTKEKRTIVKIIELISLGFSVTYRETPEKYRVDPDTGKLVERE